MSVKLVCIGDSLTYGYGVSEYHAWPQTAGRMLSADIVNRGENGDTTAQMLVRFYEDVICEAPAYAVIMGGANDILLGAGIGPALEHIRLMGERAVDHGIVPLIGIHTGFDRERLEREWYGTGDIDALVGDYARLREGLLELCREKVWGCIDFQMLYEERMKARGELFWFIDGLHPTKIGHRVLAEIFVDIYENIVR